MVMEMDAEREHAKESTPQRLLKELKGNLSFQSIVGREGMSTDKPFLPIWGGPDGGRPGTGYVGVMQLPEDSYKKWIGRLIESKSFKDSVEESIKENTGGEEFANMLIIDIVWDELGPKFDIAPTKSCNTHARTQGGFLRYDCHNIDRTIEADLLATCLLCYLLKLYPALETLERDPTAFSDPVASNGFSRIGLEGMKKLMTGMPRT